MPDLCSFLSLVESFKNTNTHMYTNVWLKYLPIIRIVMKRALVSDQVLSLNAPDFARAGLSRKLGYPFVIGLKNGKLKNVIIDIPLASSLATLLKEDKVISAMIENAEFDISLNTKYEMTIKHIPQTETVLAEVE
jgi:hypothetical protein